MHAPGGFLRATTDARVGHNKHVPYMFAFVHMFNYKSNAEKTIKTNLQIQTHCHISMERMESPNPTSDLHSVDDDDNDWRGRGQAASHRRMDERRRRR